MIKLFTKIYMFFVQHRSALYVLLIVLVVLCGFGASRITLNEDISGFLPSSNQTRDIRFITSNLKGQDKIIVNITAKNGGALDKDYSIEATEHFVEELEANAKQYVDTIFYFVDDTQILSVAEFIASNAPYFIEEQDYVRLDSLLNNNLIDDVITRNRELLASPMGGAMEKVLLTDPFGLTSNVLNKLAKQNESSPYQTYNSYLFSKDLSRQIIVVTPRWGTNQTAQNDGLQRVIDQAVNTTLGKYDQISIVYFGAPIIAVNNASQIKKDSFLSITISLVLILGLMFYVLRSFRKMLLVALPVVFGALFSLAVIWLIQGTISAIAIGAGSIIFGIAISYSIHFVLHSAHSVSMQELISEIAQPMTVGSLSTVGAFLSLLFIRAEAMRDFGLFAALSLIGAILFVMIFMPHLVGSKAREIKFKKISSYRFEKNRWIILSIVALTTLFLCYAPRTAFDTDLQNINFMSEQQREDMQFIIEPDAKQRTLCIAAVSDNMDSALVTYSKSLPVVEQLVNQGLVLKATNFGDIIPAAAQQTAKIERWNTFWGKWDRTALQNEIEIASVKNGFTEGAFSDFYHTLNRNYTVENIDFFKHLPFVEEFIVDGENRDGVVTFLTVSSQNADKVIAAVNSIDGVVAFDKDSINSSMVQLLATDFNFVLYICGVIVFVLLWMSFGRIEITFVAFAPMVISWVWILGIMAIFGVNFNIINIILATFIFGLGDDFSIFITDGLMHEYAYGSKITQSHKSAVILSSLTMLFGIGTLIVAKHPAMLSLAYVTLIGMLSVVIMAYIVPPLLFNYLVYKNGQTRLTPITIENFSKSIYSFIVFLIGSLFLTIVGFILLTISRRSDANKFKYHILLCRVARFVVKNLPMVDSKFINEHNETFEKPAVIIANHQSHLDLMYMLALSPKVIILTNRWVWRSPFYGLIIRYADFLPVANGIENSVEKLGQLVNKGYSIVVFPEGTRSADEQIHRFHKGAFYLASKLGIDILPVVTHGIGGALPKQEFLMRHSSVVVSIMQRMRWGDMDINQQAKETRKLMSDELAKIVAETENCDYFFNKVISNYIYKGAHIERIARKELKENGNFRELITQLPHKGAVLIENCGIGVGSLMSSLVRRDLTIYATDSDSKKLLLASKCGSVPDNLHYVENSKGVNFDKLIQL